MNNEEKIKKAKLYLEKYNLPLLKKWNGYKLFLHVWHQPKIFYPLTYDNYIDRIIEIAETKPQHERQERFLLMKPSSYAARVKAGAAWVKAYAAWVKAGAARVKAGAARVKAYAAWVKAYAARDKAYAAWDKAYAAWVKADAAWVKADAAWVKAYAARDKAYAAWVKTDEKNILLAHAKDCPHCKWEGDLLRGRLPQFD